MSFDKMVYGDKLSLQNQRRALREYVHRFTREHRPAWARSHHKKAKPYAVQFDSDQEWLKNTRFSITLTGQLDGRCQQCYSEPTWPDNPELRKPNAQRRLPHTETK